jgi:hypothetical protein
MAWKSGRKVPFLPLGRSCPLQTILLSDLVGCDSPLQIVMAVCPTTPDPESLNSNKKRVPNCHYYLQRAVTPD